MPITLLERHAKHKIQRFSEVLYQIDSQSLCPSINIFQRLVDQLKSSGMPLTHAPDTGNRIRFAHIDTPLLRKKPAEFTQEDLQTLIKATLALEEFLVECHLSPSDELVLRVTVHTTGEEH